jgi:4-hydroxy-tetrahydrodipicolinate synthase
VITNEADLFGRVLTAMVTPFDKNLKIDYPAVEKLVEHLIKTGTTTLVVAGTTGESPTLEKDEKKELLKAVIDIAKKRVKVIMGTGTNDTAKSIKTTQNAEELGADGALVVAPYYNKPSQAGLTAHFGEIAKSTRLPIMMYNIPGRTGITIGAETIIDLSHKHKNIYAVKDSTGSVELSGDIASHAREDACGVVSVASHFLGQEITRMQDAFFTGKLDVARAAHYEAMPLFKGLFAAPNPTCVKYALSRLGICGENLRLPLVPLSDAQKKDMDTLLAKYDLAKSLSLK